MRKNFISLLPAMILFFMLSVSSVFPSLSAYGADSIDLRGTWKIIETDSPGNASLKFNDSEYPDKTIPGNWLDILRKNSNLDSTLWIRKKVFISSSNILKEPVLFIERIGIADEAYFNGVKIGSSGIFPSSPGDLHYQIVWNTPRRYFIPDNLINYDGENVVAVRIYSHVQSGVVGEVAIHEYSRDYFGQVYSGYKPLLVSIAAVMLNFMLLFVFMLLYLSETKKREYLYFFLIILCTLLCSSLTFPLPFMMDGLLRYKLGLFLYTVTNFFVFMGVKEFLAFKNKIIFYAALALLVVVETLVLAAPDSRFLIFYSAIASLLFVNISILFSAGMFIMAVKKDPRRYWYFLLMVIPVTISVIRNSYYIFSYRFNELPLAIFMHVPLVFMFITLYYIYDFEKSKKEKDLLYKALLRKSKSDIRLIKSIKDKNKKPEPRDLIANVIEYLDVNFSEKYDRIELSKKFGLNEDYMGQIFKKATGTNISNYINTNRINAAKELLTDTSAKIIDIAYHVGFDNLTHFHRQFKIQTGCTPNEYRASRNKL